MKRLLYLLALTLLGVMQTYAYSFEVGGIYYNTIGSNATVTYKTTSYNSYSGDVVIPSEVTDGYQTYTVTKIGDNAFRNCGSLTSVEVPTSVTSIGQYAFANCSLASVELPAATSIGYAAFQDCSSLASVELSAATSIGSYAFYGCSLLASVELPAATSIGSYAFDGCSLLASVELPAATSIGYGAFCACSKINSLRIGSVEQWCKVNLGAEYANPLCVTSQIVELYIGDSETPATSIDVPNTVVSIPNYAFCRTSITSVTATAATSIGSSAFYYCSSLASVDMPAATSIGGSAFSGCSSLTSVELPAATSIGSYAFHSCFSLASVELPAATSIGSSAFYYCSSLASVSIPAATSIGSSAFCYCSKINSLRVGSVEQWCKVNFGSDNANPLYNASQIVELYIGDSETPATSIDVPSAVTSIPNYAFHRTSITPVEIPSSITSIGSSAFKSCPLLTEIIFKGNTPAATSSCFDSYTSLVVPDEAYNDYVASWESYKNQITIAGQREREVDVVANDSESAIHKAVGEENLRHVLRLKVKGSINGYDIMLIRNKMINLHHLDLSEAIIEGNDYEYYTGYHTSDNEIGPYAFYNLPNLFRVKLPEVTAIRHSAFASCAHLHEINLPESLTTLGSNAFNNCYQLTSIEIPGSVGFIGDNAFRYCYRLANVTFHEGLKTIGSAAFYSCGINNLVFPESLETINSSAFAGGSYEDGAYRYNSFTVLNLPPNLNTIGSNAFESCTSLQVVRLNPMLKNISDNAFSRCGALKKVYSYTLEPTSINQNTYSTYQTADLYVPTPSYYTYFYNTQWSQFLSVNKSDEEYDFKSFYITKDYELDDTTGNLGGDPDGELGDNSGLIHNGSETQALGTVTMRFNGNNGSASIIANGNLTAEKIKVEITVTGNKWHFFCFPFDVPLTGVSVSGDKAYVFRHYNAAKRATGASGWENLPAEQDHLIAGEGYIFQTNGNATLTVEVDNKTTFVGENVASALHVQDATNVANASWNFKGNPGYAYFDIDDLGFSAPITVWDPNTNNYVALRPGVDDAFLHPFQAFFVQKPDGTDELTFNAEDRTTYLASQKQLKNKIARRRAASNADNPRKLINLTVTDGENTDKTRVVFNDEKSLDYEMDCDAAKFAATGVPQLYSMNNDNTHYAINERPYGDGNVRLGFTADKNGRFSIEAQRMDAPCYLRDLDMGTTHDLTLGAYEFDSQKGTFENRFVLVNSLVVTGIESVEIGSISADAEVYDLQGRRMERAVRGVCIVNGKKVNVK